MITFWFRYDCCTASALLVSFFLSFQPECKDSALYTWSWATCAGPASTCRVHEPTGDATCPSCSTHPHTTIQVRFVLCTFPLFLLTSIVLSYFHCAILLPLIHLTSIVPSYFHWSILLSLCHLTSIDPSYFHCSNLLPLLHPARAMIKVSGHQYWWLAGGYDLEIEHF